MLRANVVGGEVAIRSEDKDHSNRLPVNVLSRVQYRVEDRGLLELYGRELCQGKDLFCFVFFKVECDHDDPMK